jgi:hypothetical protein
MSCLNLLEYELGEINQTRQEFKKAVEKSRNRHAMVFSLIFSFILFAIYILNVNKMGHFQLHVFAIIIIMFTLIMVLYGIYVVLWNKNILFISRKRILKKYLPEFESQKEKADEKIEQILEEGCIKNPIVDRKLLNIPDFFVISQSLQTRQADSLEEAVARVDKRCHADFLARVIKEKETGLDAGL